MKEYIKSISCINIQEPAYCLKSYFLKKKKKVDCKFNKFGMGGEPQPFLILDTPNIRNSEVRVFLYVYRSSFW